MTLRDAWIKEYNETNGESLDNAIHGYKEPNYWLALKIDILKVYVAHTARMPA